MGCARLGIGVPRQNRSGKEHDSESENDYFEARYYGSGRFMVPDRSAQVEPIPYAKLKNPQSPAPSPYKSNQLATRP